MAAPAFNADMYRAALAWYGLPPTDYNCVFKSHSYIDRNGEQQKTLRSCSAARESLQGNAVWVQINRPFEGAAIRKNGEYTYPKKAANKDIQWIANVSLDCEYPPNPEISHQIVRKLIAFLIAEGLAMPGQPQEDSGAGDHIGIPIPPIEAKTPEDAELWNAAVYRVVKEYIKPEFDRLVKEAGVEMDLEGADISRVLSIPGTWRPSTPDKEDCDWLKSGYQRRWMEPYVNGHYPERKECVKLAELIQEAYTQVVAARAQQKTKRKSTPKAKPGKMSPEEWLTYYVEKYPNDDRSAQFHSLVKACYKRYGEEITSGIAEKIDELSGAKYNGRLNEEFDRSFKKVAEEAANEPPQFIIEGQLREQEDHALEILAQAHAFDPKLFMYLSQVSRLTKDENDDPMIQQLDWAGLRHELSCAANFYKRGKEDGEDILVHALPPRDLAEQLLALSPSAWPLRPIKAIVQAPVLRPDGSILNKSGYDPATRLYYIPGPGMERCRIPDEPTVEEIQQAIERLLYIFSDFPFESDADRANALALLITPFIRHAVKKDIQMALIDATNAGSGKGLISKVVSITATGSDTTPIAAKRDDEEWRKSILSILLKAPRIVIIDNIRSMLESATLELLLTGGGFDERILGQSKTAKPKNEATWMATGNNLLIGGDLPRRCYRIRLVSKTARPEERTDIKEADLEQYVLDHRPEIISAILTLARAWYAAGKPKPKGVPNLGTFTQWAHTVGGILEYSGVEGFQGNRDELRSKNNEEAQEWEAFLRIWHKVYGSDWKTAKEIAKDCTADSYEKNLQIEPPEKELAEALPKWVKQAALDKPKSFEVSLGIQLGKRDQTVYGTEGYRIMRDFDKDKGSHLWKIEKGVPGGSGGSGSQRGGKNQEAQNTKYKEDDSLYFVFCNTENSTGGRLQQPPEPPESDKSTIDELWCEYESAGSTPYSSGHSSQNGAESFPEVGFVQKNENAEKSTNSAPLALKNQPRQSSLPQEGDIISATVGGRFLDNLKVIHITPVGAMVTDQGGTIHRLDSVALAGARIEEKRGR